MERSPPSLSSLKHQLTAGLGAGGIGGIPGVIAGDDKGGIGGIIGFD